MTNIRPATMKLARLTPLPETDPDRSDFECGCAWYYATAESDAAMWVCPDHRRPMGYDAMREALRKISEAYESLQYGEAVETLRDVSKWARAALAAAEGKGGNDGTNT